AASAVRVRPRGADTRVVCGPPRLERASNGYGALGAHTVRDLKRLDAGGWWEARFAGQRIQTLQEVLERFRDAAPFWIEPCADIGREADLEERLVSTLEIYDALERCSVWSADVGALDRIRALNPDVRLGVIWPLGRPQPLPALRT